MRIVRPLRREQLASQVARDRTPAATKSRAVKRRSKKRVRASRSSSRAAGASACRRPALLGDDRAAVRLGDLAHDREPEARAGHAARRRSRGRSGRRRAAGRPRRCRGRDRAPSARRRASVTSTSPPRGLHFAALSSRFAIARSMRRRHAVTIVDSSRSASISTSGRLRVVRSIASAATRSSRTSSELPAAAPRRARARSSSAISAVISPSCSTTSCSSCLRSSGASAPLAREHLDVRAQARQRRAQLVRGVGTSCRCARADSSSASSIVLKLPASRLSSSPPVAVDPLA